MATWRQYDKLENRAAEAGGAAVEFMSVLMDISPELEPLRAQVMAAAQDLGDKMRKARRAAQSLIERERGYRS